MGRPQTPTIPRGTHDVLPDEWRVREFILEAAQRRFATHGFGRISTPTFEHTELFVRGVGETTDVVGKEMYTFTDRGDRSLTLRPEGTAPVVRAFLTHGMHREPMPVRLWYSGSMFRYEKPQAGRLREHTQIGAEVFGSSHAAVDAEVITMLDGFYRHDLQLDGLTLHLNSIGPGSARAQYRDALVDYLTPFRAELDADSQVRLDTNPLRIFDAKHPRTIEIMQHAPRALDHLPPDDRRHFDELCTMLDAAEVDYVIDPMLVRGLDYYTRTVFEFTSGVLGAQSTVGGGGRYDNLVATLGGPDMPAVGFGCGLERLIIAMGERAAQITAQSRIAPDVFVGVAPDASSHDDAWATAMRLTSMLRTRGFTVELDLAERSAKGQAKHAARIDASVRVFITDAGSVTLHTRSDRDGAPCSASDPADLAEHVARAVQRAATSTPSASSTSS